MKRRISMRDSSTAPSNTRTAWSLSTTITLLAMVTHVGAGTSSTYLSHPNGPSTIDAPDSRTLNTNINNNNESMEKVEMQASTSSSSGLVSLSTEFSDLSSVQSRRLEKADDLDLEFIEKRNLLSPAVCLPTFGLPKRDADKTIETNSDHYVYRVGVLAIRGPEAAFNEFNATFSEYLTATAGKRFTTMAGSTEPMDSGIRFELKALNFLSLFDDTESNNVDFIYVNPSAFSCIESEYTAHSLVSQVSRRNILGNIYDLTQFGGVIFARADNDEIQDIQDLRDKKVAAASISGLGSGQMQFLEMIQNDLSYINDPKQLIFTSNQGKVVKGVLNEDFDVGFVRTDQLERTKDDDGNPVDLDLIKIINPRYNISLGGGETFPFVASTDLYPEWNVAALEHVHPDISQSVQHALLALEDHAHVGDMLDACEAQLLELPSNSSMACDMEYVFQMAEMENFQVRCDTTKDIARLAKRARDNGKYSAWKPTLSYMQLRSMQEATGFIKQDAGTRIWRCVRSAEIYDAISCPAGFDRKSKAVVESSCETAGLDCLEGFQCLCRPCEPVFECSDGIRMGDPPNCVAYKVLFPSVLVPIFVVTFLAMFCYIEHKKRKSDSVFHINRRDLDFGDPITVIGQGTFGQVLLADYRGTKVAVKRVIPRKTPKKNRLKIYEKNNSFLDTSVVRIMETFDGAAIMNKRNQDDDSTKKSRLGSSDSRKNSSGHKTVRKGIGSSDRSLKLSVRSNSKRLSQSVRTQKGSTKNIVPERPRVQFSPSALLGASIREANAADAAEAEEADESVDLEVGLNSSQRSNKSSGSEKANSLNSSAKNSADNLGMKSLGRDFFQRGKGLNNSLERIRSSSASGLRGRRSYRHSKLKADFVEEIRQLAHLRHPCITTVMGAVISRTEEPMLVMEFMSRGSLFDCLHDPEIEFSQERLRYILQDIAQGLRFLHSAEPYVIHGDLKSQNVLVDSNFRAKVSDFGLSAKRKLVAVGTPYWMSPELLDGDSTNTKESDIYAFGIVLYEVLSRDVPYPDEDHEVVLKLVCDKTVNKRPILPSSGPSKPSREMAELYHQCVHADPAQRPSAGQVDLTLKVEYQVAQSTGALEATNKELEQANRKIAAASALQLQHFACMSHEIRTPLNCVIGLSSLMAETNLDPQQQETMQMIVSSGNLLRCIVDDVLDYSKLESGKVEIDVQHINLQALLNSIMQQIRISPVAESKQVSVLGHYDPSLTEFIDIDSRRLQQILYNLLSNAVKFSKADGSVDVFASIGKYEDSEIYQKGFHLLRFEVHDSGKGIASNDFEKIFQPFAQTKAGIENLEGGTGLGLAITKRLVEAMDGRIKVNSKVGEWTKFTVDFPFKGQPAKPDDLAAKLQAIKIFMIADGFCDKKTHNDIERTATILKDAKLDVAPCRDTDCLLEKLQMQKKSQISVVIIHERVYTERFENLMKQSSTSKVRFITFGPKFMAQNSDLHFSSLADIFPMVLMEGLTLSSEKAKQSVDEAEETKVEVLHEPVELSKLKVLIADDNLVNQKVLKRLVNRIGIHDVQVVKDGTEAVEAEAAEPFDLVLMDMQMPKMDGLEATKIINQRRNGHPRAKILFVTAHVSADFEKTCLDNGAAGYLPKPITIDTVKKAIENVQVSTRTKSLSPKPKARPPRPRPPMKKANSLMLPLDEVESFSDLKVLIADDIVLNQKVLKRILTRIGITDISIVDNGKKAAELEAREQFHIVWMDLQMPVMDGMQATKLIVNRSGMHPPASIVFVTAHVSDDFREQCIAAGAVGYLPKPCSVDSVKTYLVDLFPQLKEIDV